MEYFLLLLAGLLCGFFNTVASSGSAVTLPFLIFMGLPPAVATIVRGCLTRDAQTRLTPPALCAALAPAGPSSMPSIHQK